MNLRNTTTSEVVYTAEELEFLRAVDRYKKEQRRPHPTWREVLALVHSLGYRKLEGTTASPTFGPRPATTTRRKPKYG